MLCLEDSVPQLPTPSSGSCVLSAPLLQCPLHTGGSDADVPFVAELSNVTYSDHVTSCESLHSLLLTENRSLPDHRQPFLSSAEKIESFLAIPGDCIRI